jgi:myotubularin-related protein 6/7/8
MLDKFGGMPGVSTKSPLQCGLLGTLYLTATHLIFVDQDGKQETWVLHSHLASIEKQAISTSGTPIHIRCKNFCSVTFVVPRERDAHELYTSLYQISQPIRLEDLYCFQYTASSEPFQNDRLLGWNKFTLKAEFERQGVPNDRWRETLLNAKHELCDTYPSVLCVPASVGELTLAASARFRSKNRLPVLSYFHKRNQAVICRCSQPLSGFSQRSPQDEQLMQGILDANPNVPANGSRKCLYVVDTRPKVSHDSTNESIAFNFASLISLVFSLPFRSMQWPIERPEKVTKMKTFTKISNLIFLESKTSM